jgi:hypothetical protein
MTIVKIFRLLSGISTWNFRYEEGVLPSQRKLSAYDYIICKQFWQKMSLLYLMNHLYSECTAIGVLNHVCASSPYGKPNFEWFYGPLQNHCTVEPVSSAAKCFRMLEARGLVANKHDFLWFTARKREIFIITLSLYYTSTKLIPFNSLRM